MRPDGLPIWTSDALPGHLHDLSCADLRTSPQRCTGPLPNRTYNALLRSLRCLGERGFALLVGRWRSLRHITASPRDVGDIVRAALVRTRFEHRYLPDSC